MSQPMSMTAMPTAPYKYVSLPNAVKSTSKTMRFQASNGTSWNPITSNNIARIDIRSNGFLCGNESYLKFSITNNSNQTISLDPMATCVIDRIRLLSGAVVLSDISGYAELASHLVVASGTDDLIRTLSIVSGYIPSGSSYTSATNLTNKIGTLLSSTYTIPLISGLMSGSRYIPLEFLAGGLTIELYFQTSFFKAFKEGTAGTPPTLNLNYTISNLEYVGKIVQIDDDVQMNNLKQLQLTQGLKIKSYDWSLHQNFLASGSNGAVFNIPARNLSLKSLVMLTTHASPTAVISGIQSFRSTASGYYVRIGSTQYPIQEISIGSANTNLVEAFSELMKCYSSGGLFNVLATTAVQPVDFTNDGSTGALLDSVASFAMGVSLENYGESDLFSGLDTATLSLPVNFVIKHNANTAFPINALCYANYDVVYTILPNGMVQVDY